MKKTERKIEMLFSNKTFTVKHDDILTLCSKLELKRDYSVDMAKYAIEAKDYGLYLDQKYKFAELNSMLSLDMFNVFPSVKEIPEFPEYPLELIENIPFFDDPSEVVVFSDGSVIEESEVPF